MFRAYLTLDLDDLYFYWVFFLMACSNSWRMLYLFSWEFDDIRNKYICAIFQLCELAFEW
jgi:hypothetical protein